MVDINIELDADDEEVSPEIGPFVFIAVGDSDEEGTSLSMRSAYLSHEDVIAVLEEMADAVRELLESGDFDDNE